MLKRRGRSPAIMSSVRIEQACSSAAMHVNEQAHAIRRYPGHRYTRHTDVTHMSNTFQAETRHGLLPTSESRLSIHAQVRTNSTYRLNLV